jgi:hypothetical protein
VLQARQYVQATAATERFEAAAHWLQAHSAPGERVFQTDWDDFPELFFHNTHNTYIVGLDPSYLSLADPQLYQFWQGVGRGFVREPSQWIRGAFEANWVITDREQRLFLERARSDPGLEVVFENASAVVFRVKR